MGTQISWGIIGAIVSIIAILVPAGIAIWQKRKEQTPPCRAQQVNAERLDAGRDINIQVGNALPRRATNDTHTVGRASTPSKAKFQELERLMPKLIAEMRKDVLGEGTKLVREFRVKIRADFPHFSDDSPRRFEYNTVTHADLYNMLSLLADAGFVRKITFEQFPIYRMTEEFIELLKERRIDK